MHIIARFEEGKRGVDLINSFIGNHGFFRVFFGHDLIFDEKNKTANANASIFINSKLIS